LGYDTPSLDNPGQGMGCAIDSPIHKQLLNSEIWLVEYLNIPNEMPSCPTVDLFVSPLKIEGADGSPARCWIAVK